MALRKPRNLAGKLVLLIASVAGTALAVELVLETRTSTLGHAVWPPHLDETFDADPRVMPGVTGPSKFTTNALGIRGDELEAGHELRILAIGGSTTESLYLDDSEAWPRLAQEELQQLTGRKVWVGNVGRSGFNSRFYWVVAEELLPKIPDLDVAVVLTGINDLAYRLAQDSEYRPMDVRQDPDARRTVRRRAFLHRPLLRNPTPFYELPELRRRVQTLRGPDEEKSPSFLFQDHNGAIYVRWRLNRRRASSIRPTLPDLRPALAEYRQNLRGLVELGRRSRVAVVLITQPVAWQPGLPEHVVNRFWFGGIGDFQAEAGRPYYSIEALAEAMARYNDVTREVCQEKRIECIDLASRLPARPIYFYDDCHFNEEGARQVAQIVAPKLASVTPDTFGPDLVRNFAAFSAK